VAGRPLRPATDRRLGGPLPRQLANRTQATPKAHRCFGPQAVCGISPGFPGLSPTFGHIPTRCSPVRHSPCGACDLHVLGMPPAFALSQDQTLKFIRRDQAEARSRRRLSTGLRSPLSMRSAFSGSSHAPAPPLRGTAQAGKSENARLLPKDICNCQRSGPSRDTKPTKRRPHVAAGQRTGALRHENQDLQPHGPQPPDTAASPPEGVADWPARKEQPLRCKESDLAPKSASFKTPIRTSPQGSASRQTLKLVPFGPDFKTQ
jgi:hypothetical protein